MASKASVIAALAAIQGQLKAPKDQNAGRYRYRNIEDINQVVKPLAAECGCAVTYTDYFKLLEGTDWIICESSCILTDSAEGTSVQSHGCALVNTQPKGMSIEQACGAASSYARKYAACGLFAIDSSEDDPDRTNAQKKAPRREEPKADPLMEAKRDLMAAINTWAELHGADPRATAEGIRKRPDYEETADFYERAASEFRADSEI